MFPFSSPPAARCRGDAPAALLLPAPTDPLGARAACVVASGAPEGAVRRVQMAWAWPGELGHGLGSLGIAWKGWVWPGELRHGLGSSGITWRAWASPGELWHCLGSSSITWRAPALPGELRHRLELPRQVEQCSEPWHRCPLLRWVGQPAPATPAPPPPNRGPTRCKRSLRSIPPSPAATPRSRKASSDTQALPQGSAGRGRGALRGAGDPREQAARTRDPKNLRPQGAAFGSGGTNLGGLPPSTGNPFPGSRRPQSPPGLSEAGSGSGRRRGPGLWAGPGEMTPGKAGREPAQPRRRP